MIKILLTCEGEDPIELDAIESETVPFTPKSRRPSIAAMEIDFPPGEKAVARKKQQRNEIIQEARELINHFNRKMIDSLVRSVRSTLEKMRHSLLSPSGISYGQASEKDTAKKPILKLKLSLEIPNITVSPPLEEVQGSVNQSVQLILQVFKEVYLWGQLELQSMEEQPANDSTPSVDLSSPSQPNATAPLQIMKPELRTFYRTISEHKEVAKLASSLSSIISSTKTVVTESFSHFNVYKDLWQLEQEKKITEFMEKEPLLSDFENELRYFENLEVDITAEEDSITVGSMYLDASKHVMSIELCLIICTYLHLKCVYAFML